MCRRLLAVSFILQLVDVWYPGPVRVPYSSVYGSRLLILALINGFHDAFRAILHSRWLGRSLIHLLVNGFHDRFRTVLLRGWQPIAHTSARQRLLQRLARRIALQMAADCSYFRESKAFTMDCVPYCSGSGLLILPLVNGFHDGLHAIFHSRWQRIAHSFSRQWLS